MLLLVVFLPLLVSCGLGSGDGSGDGADNCVDREGQDCPSASFTSSEIVDTGVPTSSFVVASDGRIFIAHRPGIISVVKDGKSLPNPFAVLTVESSSQEAGLIGITLDPAFPTSPYVYVHYTVPGTPPHGRVSRLTADGDVSIPGSETVVFELDGNLGSTLQHNGGEIKFGRDGMLYIGAGDTTDAATAQSLTSTHGKILRVNPDGTVPEDNPFSLFATGKYRSIWAMGLRNPFSFAFDPPNGALFVNDVGNSDWEEVNLVFKGGNYGWPGCEGACNGFRIDPIHQYDHSAGRAITGAVFYRADNFPSEFDGDYFFADAYGGFIMRLDAPTYAAVPFMSGLSQPVDLDVGPDGVLYWLGLDGKVHKITVD